MTTTINASNSGGGGLVQTADASGVLALQTAGTTAVTIDASQNVGIGTSSPAAKFQTNSTDGTIAIFRTTSGANNGRLNIDISDSAATAGFAVGGNSSFPAMTFANGGAERMRIDSSGNVGIGTASPGYKLALESASNFAIHLLKTGSNDGWVRNIGTMDIAAASGGGGGQAITFSNGANFAGLTERMRIDGIGNVLVGTTSSFSGGNVLGVMAQASGLPSLGLNRTTSTGPIARFYYASTEVGNISVTGSATAYNTSSDYRLKNSIAPMTGALAKVALLKPCTYKWNVDGSDGQGFIAHELDEVVPGCVTGEKDAVETYTDEDGNEATRPAYQGIDTSFLVATLTAAIQEQQALITSLTARIAALEGTPA